MKPIRSHMTNKEAGPPELDRPFTGLLKKYAPPYSLPYIRTEFSDLPNMSVTEWRPSEEELRLLVSGQSIYLAIFQEDQPMTSMFVGEKCFGGPELESVEKRE